MPNDLPALGPKTLRLTRAAAADFDSIIDDIDNEAGDDIAQRFADALDAELVKLVLLGHGGVPREAVSAGLLLTVFGNYSIYFRLTDDETIVVRILLCARDTKHIPSTPKGERRALPKSTSLPSLPETDGYAAGMFAARSPHL